MKSLGWLMLLPVMSRKRFFASTDAYTVFTFAQPMRAKPAARNFATSATSACSYCGKSVQREINASAQVSSDNPHSGAVRGYNVVDFRELTEMSPATAARAQQLAKQYLAADSIEHVEWQLSTIYLPIWEGDTVELVISDGEEAYQGVRHCLVKNVELKLSDMTMQLTLKETSSGDDAD